MVALMVLQKRKIGNQNPFFEENEYCISKLNSTAIFRIIRQTQHPKAAQWHSNK